VLTIRTAMDMLRQERRRVTKARSMASAPAYPFLLGVPVAALSPRRLWEPVAVSRDVPGAEASRLSPRTGEHEIDLRAAALRADKALDQRAHRQIGAVASRLLGGVGLELVLAISAPDNQSCLRRSRTAERSLWPGVGLHRADRAAARLQVLTGRGQMIFALLAIR